MRRIRKKKTKSHYLQTNYFYGDIAFMFLYTDITDEKVGVADSNTLKPKYTNLLEEELELIRMTKVLREDVKDSRIMKLSERLEPLLNEIKKVKIQRLLLSLLLLERHYLLNTGILDRWKLVKTMRLKDFIVEGMEKDLDSSETLSDMRKLIKVTQRVRDAIIIYQHSNIIVDITAKNWYKDVLVTHREALII